MPRDDRHPIRKSRMTAGPNGFGAAMMDQPLLDQAREIALIRQWQEDGDIQARNEVATAYIKFVMKRVQGYARFANDRDDLTKDLLQAGTFGLYKALDKFEIARGFRFSTYASRWVNAYIEEESRTLRRIAHHPNSAKLRKLVSNLPKAYKRIDREARAEGRIITNHERQALAADMINLDVAYIRELENIAISSDRSLNEQVGLNDGRGSLERQDLLVDTSRSVLSDMISDAGARTLAALLTEYEATAKDPRKPHILRIRVYVEAGDVLTLEDLGALYGISRERVRQLEMAALKDLRQIVTRKKMRLQDFV